MEGEIELTAKTLAAVSGWDFSSDYLMDIGARLLHLERAFNIRHGFTPSDDYNVPRRLLEAPPDGKASGKPIGPYLKGMIDRYYEVMGWDLKTGKPWRETLKKAGLDEVATDLWGDEYEQNFY